MSVGVKWVILVILLLAVGACGCRKSGGGSTVSEPAKAEPEVPFVKTKEFVAPRGRGGKADNPPCIRRGMEEVMLLAKAFATQQKQPSYAILGNDTATSPMAVEDPRRAQGLSILMSGVEEELKGAGPQAAKALEGQTYASCTTLAFLLPKNATQGLVAVSAGAADGTLQPCNLTQDGYMRCQAGQAAWVSFHENRYLVMTFKNWADDLDRPVKIEITP